VLIEADPDQARNLEARFDGRSDIQVIRGALTVDPSPVLLRCDAPDLNSVSGPNGRLREVFPDLTFAQSAPLVAVAPASVRDVAGFDSARVRALVLDVNGGELGVLEAMSKAGALGAFDHVLIRVSSPAMFEHEADPTELVAMLKAAGRPVAGFRKSGMKVLVQAGPATAPITPKTGRTASPERGNQVPELDSVKKELRSLKSKLAHRERRIEAQRAEAETERDRLSAALAAATGRAEAAEAASAEAGSECDNLRSELAAAAMRAEEALAAHQAAHARFSGELHEALTRAEAAEAASAAAGSECDNLRLELAAAAMRAEEALTRAEAAEAASASHAESAQRANADNEWLKGERDTASAEATRARADLAVALRLQGLANADLRDLREKYAALALRESQQADLLARLSSALGEAASFVDNLLAGENPDAAKHATALLEGAQEAARTAPDSGRSEAESALQNSKAGSRRASSGAGKKPSLKAKKAVKSAKRSKARKPKSTPKSPK
jgi:hypothetical protein